MSVFNKTSSISYFRNFIFGVEDSLVSTVGLLSGVAIADVPGQTIFLTGVVLIFVEAFSMAAGTFLSEYSAEEYRNHSEKTTKSEFVAGIVMFFSYFISGFIPLFPYIKMPVDTALKVSVSASVASLFILGIVAARITGTNILKNSIRMVLVGGIAIVVGMVAGNLISMIM
jgi:VIT1/CCC1 family predicted Fe2+/Mn2+ transporter